jgi:hypothetical protein
VLAEEIRPSAAAIHGNYRARDCSLCKNFEEFKAMTLGTSDVKAVHYEYAMPEARWSASVFDTY